MERNLTYYYFTTFNISFYFRFYFCTLVPDCSPAPWTDPVIQHGCQAGVSEGPGQCIEGHHLRPRVHQLGRHLLAHSDGGEWDWVSLFCWFVFSRYSALLSFLIPLCEECIRVANNGTRLEEYSFLVVSYTRLMMYLCVTWWKSIECLAMNVWLLVIRTHELHCAFWLVKFNAADWPAQVIFCPIWPFILIWWHHQHTRYASISMFIKTNLVQFLHSPCDLAVDINDKQEKITEPVFK